MTSPQQQKTVLILGAGINGCALARELLLNGISVSVVDANDVAWGATSRSSRLIHGGLRYLEYGDFHLVRESLQERMLLRKLAPQFVEPLRLYIPVRRRFAGLLRSAFRFFGGSRFPPLRWLSSLARNGTERGLWLVRLGLWFYDQFAWGADFPKSSVTSPTARGVPQVDKHDYRWLCAYTDAQMRFPERFVVAMLADARRIAAERDVSFQIWTYHHVALNGNRATIRRRDGDEPSAEIEPALIVNATGAWGDLTLHNLHVPSPQLFGGTKGSHFISSSPRLREALGNSGLYAEAADGRLIFVLPFGASVLVGTTDEIFPDSPDRAIATPAEIDYLVGMVNHLFPQLDLERTEIDMHYAGVRPLPKTKTAKAGAISRDHSIEKNNSATVPVWTLVGGKLTTARAFAEQVAQRICARFGLAHKAESRDRPIPGGENYPADEQSLATEFALLADKFQIQQASVRQMWALYGSRLTSILREIDNPSIALDGTQLPLSLVQWVIHREWATTIGDLVERRLMLLYEQSLSKQTLRRLAQCLADAGRLPPDDVESAVENEVDRLKTFYGKTVTE
jgi:glycerol-3-phosphate dehydrogenase